jgi:sucrose-6-phosphate hydrolase SacC (GH32 family)
MDIEGQYVHLPVTNGAPLRRMSIAAGGKTVREFDIELADAEPDFWVFLDVSAHVGQRLVIEVAHLDPGSLALDSLLQSDSPPDAEHLYGEEYRPQFHFSSRRGWNNDPNGLVYHEGRYHLFYQHNPYGVKWGNMHWGHAVSTDLVHWHELGDALYPDHLGTCFSGSGVVDGHNTAGLQTGDEQVLACVYTSAGEPFTQSLAYSNDGGRSVAKYAGNPVMGHIIGRNRDPKVIWHDPTQRWVMALYLDGNDYALFSSPDLKRWTRSCDIQLPGCTECPDFFPLPVDGDSEDTRWVFWGANGTYALGSFDGLTFDQEGDPQRYDWGGDSYAAQTWSDIPAEDGRRLQIAWLRVIPPGMPFSQQMTFPCELTLRRTPEGIRLFSEPVGEIALLRGEKHSWHDRTLRPGEDSSCVVTGELFDIQAEVAHDDAAEFVLSVHGIPVIYNSEQQQLSCEGRVAMLGLVDGRIRLRVLVDRASIEIFGNDGEIALPIGVISADETRSVGVSCRGGSVRIVALDVYELCSAWHR